MKLIDTTVAVDHLRGNSAAVGLATGIVEGGHTLAASEVVRFELLAGVFPEEIDSLERFCSAIAWLAVNEDVARVAGALAREHRRSHSGIDDANYLIAATAIVFDAELLTSNVRHFPMFEDLAPAY